VSLFAPFLRNLAPRTVTRLQGVMVTPTTGTGLVVNVNGSVIPARILDPLTVAAGDPVAVDFVAGPTGQAEAWIVGRLGDMPRPATAQVTAVPVGSPTITVTDADGNEYDAAYTTLYTPTVGDTVALSWGAGQPTVTGPVTLAPDPGPVASPIDPPPALDNSGTSTYAATDTATWTGTGWGWQGTSDVYQGDGGAGPLTGAWFYGGSPAELAGRTVTAIRFTLGPRNGAGNPDTPVTVNLSTHTSSGRPTGNVTLGTATATVTAGPWQGGTVYTLPTSFAADLLNGGGIAISGGTYAGFTGRTGQPDSGLLAIDWTR
jgi:hypothetical protein